VVKFRGVPEPDEATLNPFGLIGYALVAVTTTGRLVAYLKRGKPGQKIVYISVDLRRPC
jgi:hypothetical protein